MNKILICEKEEGIRESLKLILGDHYELILTDSTDQCLDCADHAKDVQLVLIGIDGSADNSDIIGKIKEKREDLKIIVIAGYKSTTEAEEAVRVGASGYIVKPFKSDEILSTVRSSLS